MLKREKKIRKARESFWEFVKLVSSFHNKYKEEEYLKRFCDTLQDFWENKITKPDGQPYQGLIIAMPPGHGKTWTSNLFDAWILGKRSEGSIINISYNEKQALKSSKSVRNLIMQSRTENELNRFVFSDIFPNVRIKQNERAMDLWSLEGSYFSFMSAGFNGTLTGNRASEFIIIDDPVKNHEIAFNEEALQDLYDYYTNTIISRKKDNNTKIIIIQTFWSSNDLANKIINSEEAEDFYVIKEQACKNEEKAIAELEEPQMLSKNILNFENYLKKKKLTDEMIFMANYQQELVDKKGALYPNLKHWEELPKDNNSNLLFEDIVAYCDTADKGVDYLAMVVAGKYQGFLYVLDMIYTQEPMEITESLVCEALIRNKVNIAIIESNNGGSIFARNIRKMLWDKYRSRKPIIQDVPQTNHKETRIINNSRLICENVFFPPDSKIKFPDAWNSLIMFKRIGKNKHDDIEDALTGLWERFGEGNMGRITSPISKRALGL